MPYSPHRFQVSFFADAADFSPQPKNLLKLLPAFGDKIYLASALQELGGSSVGTPFVNRLRLASEDGASGINFLSNRIDLDKNLPADGNAAQFGTLSNFLVGARSDLTAILTAFPRKANRLSVVAKYMFNELPASNLAAVYTKLVVPTPYFAEHIPFEWNVRNATSASVTIGAVNEPINVIVTTVRASGELLAGNGEAQPFDRIMFDVDVNTKPDNKNFRFDETHLKAFFDAAIQLHENLGNELRALIE